MIEQLRLIPAREPGEILQRAIAKHSLSKIFVGFSGGKDSTVTLDYMWSNFREYIAGAYHVKTGISIPSTLDFAARFCKQREIPFIDLATTANYADMVRQYGFPGPAIHNIYYNELKDDPIKAFVQSEKSKYRDHIGLITGTRIAESRRRGITCREITPQGAAIWIAPLIDWSNPAMLRYREEQQVPLSEASKTICLSGDCVCGSKAEGPAEADVIRLVYPEIDTIVKPLESELKASGNPRWQYCNGLRESDIPMDPQKWADEHPMCGHCPPPLFDFEGVPA